MLNLMNYDYKYLSCINLVSLEDYNHYFDKNLSLDKNESISIVMENIITVLFL